MTASIFDAETVQPDDEMLLGELGSAKSYLDQICAFIDKDYGEVSREWKCYNKKSGWILKIYSKKRNVLFVIPRRGYFGVSFTFGEAATQTVMIHELPGFNKQELLNAKKYAEGRTILYEVKTAADCSNVLTLIGIKMLK